MDIWLILRLDSWQGARLNDDTRSELLQELFNDWLHQRVMRLLDGEQPDPCRYTYSAANSAAISRSSRVSQSGN